MQSRETDGSATDGFAGEQKIERNFQKMITQMNVPEAGPSYIENSYDAQGRLIRTFDSTENATSITEYAYDASGHLSMLTHTSRSNGQQLEHEIHNWKLNANGKYTSMTKVRNGSETTQYTFVLDDKGNVIEEKSTRAEKSLPVVYYYYDEKGRLTDVVRYNNKAKRLLPDFVIEYNDRDLVSSLMIVPEGSDEYQRWIYQYDARGLRTKESCFNKRKQLLGVMQYEYVSSMQ